MKFTSLYFSRILNNKIFTHDFQVMGRLEDLGVTGDIQNPKVVAAVLRTQDGTKYISWKQFQITKKKGQYHLSCSQSEEVDTTDLLFLKRKILDQQIIDINGRKVVRVNDIRLVVVPGGTFVVAVDIGVEGLMRRMGLAKLISRVGIKLPSKLILWNDVEALVTTSDNVVLSKTYDKLATMHPSDLADIIEDIDTQTGMMLFNKMDNARSADVLEEMEDDAQIKVIESLSTEKAADILEEMPSDEAADILDGLEESKAEELLSNMEKETSDEIRDLMQYEDKDIGSIMNPEFIAFSSDTTVDDVIKYLKVEKPEEGLMNYIYVTNAKGKFAGKVTLRDLVFADGKELLKSLMHKDVIFMYDDDEKDQLIEVASKYNLLSIPIVNHEMQLEGNVIIHDILDEILRK